MLRNRDEKIRRKLLSLIKSTTEQTINLKQITMKNMIITLIGIIVLIAACRDTEPEILEWDPFLTGTYFFRGNGTASGIIEFAIDKGTLQAGSSGVDTIYDIQYSEYVYDKAYSVEFRRKGEYNQIYYAWVSGDKCQITGYYKYMNERLPFTASLQDEIVYSGEEQTDLNGEWDLRCDGGSYGILFLENNGGYIQLRAKEDISILESAINGSLGAMEIVFETTGSNNQLYYGWISSDKKQMSGYYYTYDDKEEPFYAYKK